MKGEHQQSANLFAALMRCWSRMAVPCVQVKCGWPQAFVRDFERIAPHAIGMVRQVRFHVAPLAADEPLLRRVEGGLGRHFKAHEDRDVRLCFDAGVHLPSRIPYDAPLRLVLTSESPIAGLPSELTA